MPANVALLKATDYADPTLNEKIATLLNNAAINPLQGKKVLVKPNLLMADALSCASPQVTAAVCLWLLNHGAQVTVGDSPAFGTAQSVSNAIGLTATLRPLGLTPANFSAGRKIALPVQGNPAITVAREALEADYIFSVARIKAHSQMRITLSVKNCYGCIMGMRKAFAHVRFGQNVQRFADCVAALWATLPPVIGICDGIIAMNQTGPRLGTPLAMGLIAASSHAPALDAAIMQILHLNTEEIPLAQALARRNVPAEANFPLLKPADFTISDFVVPTTLKEISFNPLVLARSVLRRLGASWLSKR